MFRKMKNPLKFPVYNGDTIVIPAGAENVEIDFKGSNLIAHDSEGNTIQLRKTGYVVSEGYTRCNVYRWNNKVFHV